MKSGKLLFLLMLSPALVFGSTHTLGVVLRLNDGYNSSVTALLRGVETAKYLYEGLHPGTKIALKVFPHSADLASVSAAADKVIESHVQAVIGGEMSEESIVLGDRLSEHKIVFVTPTSSNPQVTENKPYVFRACFSDKQVAEQMARYVGNVLRVRKVGILQNISSPYSNFLSEHFTKVLASIGNGDSSVGKPELFVQKVLRRTLDFSKEIELFKTNGVTHVAIFSHDNDLLRFASQSNDRDFHPVYIGSDGWGSNRSVHAHFFDGSVKGSKFIGVRTSYWKEDDSRPITTQFRKTFKKRFGADPDAWSAVSFDAAWLLIAALEKVKVPVKGENIQKALRELKDISLVTTPAFAFDEQNSPRKDLYLYRIDKGGVRYEATLR